MSARAADEGPTPTQAGHSDQPWVTTAGCTTPPQVTQAGHSGPPQVAPATMIPYWHQQSRKRTYLLSELGTYHILIALLHLGLGLYLLITVKNLHLVVMKSWYPFWAAASFFISGILAVFLEGFHKTSLAANLVTNSISFLCALAGLLVIAKDLFLESPFPFPIWTPYPYSTVHIQRLVLALFCFTFLEFFLPASLVFVAYKEGRLVLQDNLSLVPDTLMESREISPPPMFLIPLPTYEEAITAPPAVDEANQRQIPRLYPTLPRSNHPEKIQSQLL